MDRQVGKWLEGLGLGRYADAFAENEIDFSALPHITEEDLKEIGVALGARRRLLAAIAERDFDVAATTDRETAGDRATDEDAERRQLTVMFCDLAGSTALSERLDPEELRDVLRSYRERCAGIIERYDGQIAKYLGDGLLVYFGYPQAHEDDARRAVRTALDVVDAIAELSNDVGGPRNVELAVHIGIHTGLVVAGEIAAGNAREELAIVGETPNVASRIENLAGPGTVLISETTHRLIEGLFECENLGPQTLKGLSTPVGVYKVMREAAARSRFEAAAIRGLTPLVGREQEIGLLLDRWDQARDGEGQVVLLSGEAGIGKSHIVQMLCDRIAVEDPLLLRFQCSPHHTNSPFFPIIDGLGRAAGFARDDSPDAKLDKLEYLLAQSSMSAKADVSLFAALLSVPTSARWAPLELSSEKQKEMTLAALVNWVTGQTDRRQALILFEDAHWIDATSQEFLDLVVEQVQSTNALILITSRPAFISPRGGYAHATSLMLNRLSRRLSEKMVRALTGNKTLPEEVLQEILAKTDGVPLVIEELTKSVLESGFLKDEEDRYELSGPLPSLGLPASLHDSLTARLDRLGPGKDVALLAACIGREFTLRLLAAVSPLSEDVLLEALQSLLAAGLVFRLGLPSEATYSFKHALVRDAAHDLLLRNKRQEYHREIAMALEAGFPEIVAARPELIAHHYTDAVEPAKAVEFWLRAGRLAAERSADTESVGHLTNGLSVLEKLPQSSDRDARELALRLALCSPLMNAKGWGSEATRNTYARARRLCEAQGEIGQLLPVLFGQWINHCTYGEHRAGWDVATEFLGLSAQQEDAVGIMQGNRMLAYTALFLGKYAQIKSHAEKSLSLYVPQQHRSLGLDWVYDPYVGGLISRAYYQWAGGLADQSAESGDRAIAYARELNQISTLVYALVNVSVPLLLGRDLQTAEKISREALAISEEQGFPYYITWSRMLAGYSIAKCGNCAEGLSQLKDGLESLEDGGQNLYRPLFLTLLAELYLDGGLLEDAQQALVEAKHTIEQTDERMFEAEVCRLTGEVRNSQNANRLEQSKSWFERAIEIARSQGVKPLELRATVSLARLMKEHGEAGSARSVLEPIWAQFSEGFERPDLKEARSLLADLS